MFRFKGFSPRANDAINLALSQACLLGHTYIGRCSLLEGGGPSAALTQKGVTPDQVLEFTGHAVGGVCPFALEHPERVTTYLDVSLRRFDTVFPAAGSSNSAIELTCEELEQFSHSAGWIDVCKGWQETP